MEKIVIIGGGNLGTSLAKGLILSKQFTADGILIAEEGIQGGLAPENGFRVTTDSVEAAKWADILVLSVKPQQFNDLASEIRAAMTDKKFLVSTITGVSHAEIEEKLEPLPIARIIPNTALEILESMTCICFNKKVDVDQQNRFKGIFDKMGESIVVSEDLMAAGHGNWGLRNGFRPKVHEGYGAGGIEIGFNSEISHFITAQTVKGAAQLILTTKNHPEYEIDKVTTPQGITISGLNEMAHQGFSSAVIRGIVTSYNKLENIK